MIYRVNLVYTSLHKVYTSCKCKDVSRNQHGILDSELGSVRLKSSTPNCRDKNTRLMLHDEWFDFLCHLVSTLSYGNRSSSDGVSRVKRGAANQHPTKYNLDEKELERVSALARIELEDARVELERAQEAAKEMGRGAEGDEADDHENGDTNDDAWIE